MNRPLTTELIRARTKTDNLQYVKKFTLCGHDLDDLRILRQMGSLEVLSLSVNKINSLREFINCVRLQELYVRKNLIANLSEVLYLAELPDLKVLWLSENPCADHKYYREFVISALPNLESLDKIVITPEERAVASRVDFSTELQPPRNIDSPPVMKNKEYEYREDDSRSQERPRTSYQQQQSYDNYSPTKAEVETREEKGSHPVELLIKKSFI